MPGNIVEYNNPIDGLRPSEQGVQAAVQAGRRIGVFYHQEGEDIGGGVSELGKQYEDQVTRQQLSHGLAVQSQMWSNLSDDWNTTAKSADVNDASVGQKWRESTMEPALANWQKQFTTTQGQTYAAEETARMRQHFTEVTHADMSSLAGIASVQNLQTMADQYKSTAFSDPSSTDTILGALDKGFRTAVAAHGANMTADEAARVTGLPLTEAKSAVVKSAIEGWIESGPAGIAKARELLNSGKYGEYIGNPTELLQKATAVEERNASMQRSQAEWTEHTDKLQAEDSGSQIFNDISATIRAGGQPTPQQIKAAYDWSNHDTGHGTSWGALLPGRNDALQSILDRSITDASAMKFQTSNPKIAEGFYSRALLASTDPKALTQQEVDKALTVDHSISPDDHARLTAEITERNKPNSDMSKALKMLDDKLSLSMRPLLTRSPPLTADGSPNILGGGNHDPMGDVAWGEARREAHETFEAWVRSGQSPMEAQEIMTNPTNNRNFMARLPYFKAAVASGDALGYFGKNPFPAAMDQVTGQAPGGGGNVAPGPDLHYQGPGAQRKTGETPEAYLKRVGG